MNKIAIFLNLHNQPVRKKILKALLFHGVGLFVVFFGIVYKKMVPYSSFVKDMNYIYWIFGCFVPFVLACASGADRYGRDTLPVDVPRELRPHCKLKQFSIIRTFRSFYTELSPFFKQIFFYIAFLFFILPIGIVSKHAQFPLLWLMGLFFGGMLLHYVWVWKQLGNVGIVVSNDSLLLPAFGVWDKFNTVTIPWDNITHLELIGSESELYSNDNVPFNSLQKNIAFIRGVIIHYKSNNKHELKMCVVTDDLLDAKHLWMLYNYCNNHVGQQNLKLRLSYGRSPIWVCWPDETYGSAKTLAQIRLDAALFYIHKKSYAKKRMVKSRLLVTKN